MLEAFGTSLPHGKEGAFISQFQITKWPRTNLCTIVQTRILLSPVTQITVIAVSKKVSQYVKQSRVG